MATPDHSMSNRHSSSRADRADLATSPPITHQQPTADPFGRGQRGTSPDPVQNTNWFDLPLAFALVPAAGSLLTGSDLLKDFLHLAFLLYYLHNLIKVPWTLYIGARARRPHSEPLGHPDDRIRALARSELRLAELIYLVFTIIAPFLGALLLRSVSRLLSIDTVSTFSTSLFVLATGIRPWRHFIDLLRHRTEALHNVVHLPTDDSLHAHLLKLEAELHDLKSLLETKADGQSVLEVASNSLEAARKEIKRSERQAELSRVATETRLQALEALVQAVPRHPQISHPSSFEVSEQSTDRASLTLIAPHAGTPLIRRLFEGVTGVLPSSPREESQRRSGGAALMDRTEVGDDDEVRMHWHGKSANPTDAHPVLLSSYAGSDSSSVMEMAVHFTLFPLRLIRTCAYIVLRQLQ